MAATVTRTLFSLLLALLVLPSAVFAHRDDQYLQATLVVIEPTSTTVSINSCYYAWKFTREVKIHAQGG
jgi:hypothetical protein